MIKLKDFKKAYMALKVDYLSRCSDYYYSRKVISDKSHIDYDWASDNYDIIGTEVRLAFQRLAFFTECVFEMNTNPSYDVRVKGDRSHNTAHVAIDFNFKDYGNKKGCFCVEVGVYIFRDYDYYKQLLSDSHEDVLENINLIFDQNDHGMVDLPKLRADLLDIADIKKAGFPIGSDYMTIPEDYFLEHSYVDLENYIIENIAASATDFYNKLQEIES